MTRYSIRATPRLLALAAAVLAAAVLSTTPDPARAAEINRPCDVRQGFKFERESRKPYGYVTRLKIGETELAADLRGWEHYDRPLEAVGVLSSFHWNGGYADPLDLVMQVSSANRRTLAMLVHRSLSNTAVMIDFVIFQYDPKRKSYYRSVHTDERSLAGLIAKSGGELRLAIDNDASPEVRSPLNFTMTLSVFPEDQAQAIHLAVSTDSKFVKQWGVQVAR